MNSLYEYTYMICRYGIQCFKPCQRDCDKKAAKIIRSSTRVLVITINLLIHFCIQRYKTFDILFFFINKNLSLV